MHKLFKLLIACIVVLALVCGAGFLLFKTEGTGAIVDSTLSSMGLSQSQINEVKSTAKKYGIDLNDSATAAKAATIVANHADEVAEAYEALDEYKNGEISKSEAAAKAEELLEAAEAEGISRSDAIAMAESYSGMDLSSFLE